MMETDLEHQEGVLVQLEEKIGMTEEAEEEREEREEEVLVEVMLVEAVVEEEGHGGGGDDDGEGAHYRTLTLSHSLIHSLLTC